MKFAVQSLADAETAGVLDGREYLTSLDNLVLTTPTVTVTAAMKLAGRVLVRDPALVPLGIEVACIRLSASHVGVQKAALEVIEDHWDARAGRASEDALREQVELIAPTPRPRLESLLIR